MPPPMPPQKPKPSATKTTEPQPAARSMSARDLPPDIARQVWLHQRADLRRSIRAAVAKGLEAMKTPEPLTLDEWAERHFYLSAESSQGEKRWASYPFQRAMLGAMGDDDIEEVDIRKSARVGYTKMLLASLGYDAQHKRRNQALWQPTDGDSDEFCKAELEPMLRDVKVMQSVFPRFMAKSKQNTLNMKKFLGSILYLKGGTSAGNFRRMTLQSAKLDEFDGFDQKIEKSADPFTLAWKRLEGATYPKIICGTTPRIKGLSHIEKREAAADARLRYHITCPHCQVEHPLSWGGKDVRHGFKWDAHDPEGTVRHHCPHCLGSITQADYLRLWHEGVWVSECGNYRAHGKPYRWTDGTGTPLLKPPRHVAFHVWTAYSPQATWAAIVRQFLQCIKAKEAGDKAPLEGFVNETLGETWEEEVEKAEAHELQKRAEDYPLRRVPVGGLQLVAGVDVQDKRWEVTVWAIGRGSEMWPVDYQVIEGNPADEREWEERLHPYLQAPLTHWHGAPMKIAASAIDTGGHFTHQAYNFCRLHHGHKYFAIKGDSKEGMPIKGRSSSQDVNYRGRIVKGGVRLWLVGTDTAKDNLFERLRVQNPGPGYIHFSKALPLEWFKGFTAEVRRTVRTSSGEKVRWVKTAARNEPLDTSVYALFASQMLDHHKLSDAQWAKLENDLLPDLFALPPAPLEPAVPPTPAAPLAPGQIETRPAAPADAAAQAQAQAPAQPAQPAPPMAQRRRPPPPPPAPPPAPFVSPFASPEWSSRL
jgi:phage terminase large subunit GpA-like protein